MLGDLVEIDEDGYLRVVGRTDDIIIRGGKNLSAAAIEEAITGHPSVSLAAAIGIPDAVFGERAAAYVELRPDTTLSLDALKQHLEDAQASPASSGPRRWWCSRPCRITSEARSPRARCARMRSGASEQGSTKMPRLALRRRAVDRNPNERSAVRAVREAASEFKGRAFWVAIGCLICQMGLGLTYIRNGIAVDLIEAST